MSQHGLSSQDQDVLYGPLLSGLRRETAKDYSAELEFHGFGHALKTEAEIIHVHERLQKIGIPGLSSMVVVRYSALKHDAGQPQFYGLSPFEDFDSSHYACPEELSIEIARTDGRAAGIDEATLDEVEEAIWPTAAGHAPTSWAGLELCIADLKTVRGDYQSEFLPDAMRLRRERVLTKKEDLGEQGYKDFSVGLLATYVVKNLRAVRGFGDGFDPQAIFAPEIKAIEHNVERLARERAEEDGVSTREYAEARGGDVPEFFELIAA